ncbi:MAG: aminoglycoside 6-adenylyltransferase [Anaerolineae bacterium]|nr:aminoglycoside 6-adenylyltransferase [Anaerolineae bacterium]
MTLTYDLLLERFVSWAETEPAIRGAVIVGSRARTDRPADQWSDLDLMIFATDPQPYISTIAWLDHIGPYWLSFLEETMGGTVMERRVLFEDMLDVDFVFVPVEMLAVLESDPGALDIVQRGVRVVVDKDGVLDCALNRVSRPAEQVLAPLPDEATFLNTVNDFWYHTVWTAKKLRRGELWTASGCVDNYLKWRCVLPVLTWHARVAHGSEYDTWMNGRFLEQWADARAVAGLRAAFGRYDARDLWRALVGTMALFRWLAPETADLLGYAYPAQAAAQVTAWVDACLAEWQAEQSNQPAG